MKDGDKPSFVLDASIALAWCFSDEATSFTKMLLDRLITESGLVPNIWSLEVGNILVAAERRKRISFADITQFLELLGKLNIETDGDTVQRSFHEILSLAHSEKLTTYDASYLELAMRHGIPLASKDIELCEAAKRMGVKILA